MSLLTITTLLSGMWRASLMLPAGELPFEMELQTLDQKTTAVIINASEKIMVNDISFDGDSVFFRMPYYDSEIRAAVLGNSLSGMYYNYNRTDKNQIPFYAEHGLNYRFNPRSKPMDLSDQKWQITFSPHSPSAYEAIGVFQQKEQQKVWGTFIIGSGDHRYLEGIIEGDSLQLSCFDGSHAFLYKAKITADSIKGVFYSGIHWAETFEGKLNPDFELNPDATRSTLKQNVPITFYLPDLDGEMVSFPNRNYRDNVCVIQILGSWCPNCIDETAFYAEFEKKYRDRNVKFIGVSFEKTQDFEVAQYKLKRIQKAFSVEYPILYGGSTSKEDISLALPFIEKIKAYPTTLVLNKNGKLVYVHTGFTGPATGEYYLKYMDDFTHLIKTLLLD